MNHFEELGLSRSATPKEIRTAYKTLAWLLHPDRQRSEKHRKMAEIQMRRLNESVGILLDARRRKEYEDQLDAATKTRITPSVVLVPAPPPERELWFSTVDARSVFLFVAGVAVASIFWYMSDLGHMNPTTRAAAVAHVPEAASGEADLRTRVMELEERLTDMETAREQAADRRKAARSASGFPGAWYYDLDARQSDGASIPVSKRISLAIAEENGKLQGSYNAQGNPLAGQPPNTLAFRFEGKGSGSQARLPWISPGGGRGEIEIRLLGPNTLEAKWWAYATEPGIAENAGTAILRRRRTE